MRVIHGLTILLTLGIVLAACGPAPATDGDTAPATAGDKGGAPPDAQPDAGGAPAQPDFEPAPDEPNEIVAGMASGKLQGEWKAEPTPEQLESFESVKEDPEKPEGGEARPSPPDPAAIAKSTMTVAAQEITMQMGDQEMVSRYYITEDTEQSIIYQVDPEDGRGSAEEAKADRGRFKVTFEGDDKILVEPHEMEGFALTYVRST